MATEVSQFVKKVVNFSSQYGTHSSRSYTAANLAGSLNIYDWYGDRTEAFVLVSVDPYPTYAVTFFPAYVWSLVGNLPFCISDNERRRAVRESRCLRFLAECGVTAEGGGGGLV